MTIKEIEYNIRLLESRLQYLKIQVNSGYGTYPMGTYPMKKTYYYFDEIKNEKRQLIRLLKLKKLKQCLKN